MNLINLITGIVSANNTNQVVHLLTEYNAATGLSLTATTVFQPANYPAFMRWVYSRIRVAQDALTERGVLYHLNVTGKEIMRHTPYEMQRLYMYAPAVRQMEANVLSTTYHEGRVEFAPTEIVNYWQDPKDPMKVIGNAVYMGADGGLVTPENAVTVQNIFAVLTDRETMGLRRYSEGMRATPLNARGRYTNLWYHWRWRNYVDYTENAIVFTLD